MPKNSSHAFRLKRAEELDALAVILTTEGVLVDPGPLYKAANTCRSEARSKDSWEYVVERLTFRLSTLGHPIPRDIQDPTLELSLDIRGKCFQEEATDPFDHLIFDLLITGIDLSKEEPIIVSSSWHLDREVGTTHEYAHPCYHFQHGGKRVWEEWDAGNRFGGTLFLDAPRLAHPPMDAVLGVDFVLTNFIQSSKLDFRNEGQYDNLLREAQERIWKPYVVALSKAWETPILEPWRADKIWPQLSIRPEHKESSSVLPKTRP